MSNSHTGNRAWAQVSGEAILRNYETLQAMAGVDAMAVVKADAYGHGVDFVAPLLRSHGVTWLGVALPCEAMALRAAGDTGKLLCWLSTPGDPELAECVAADVDLSVSSFRELLEIATAAREAATMHDHDCRPRRHRVANRLVPIEQQYFAATGGTILRDAIGDRGHMSHGGEDRLSRIHI